MRIYNLLWLSLALLGLCSCANTRKIAYFNNIRDTVLQNPAPAPEHIIQKNDILNITVSSLNPEASYFFNAPIVTAVPSANSATGGLAGASSAVTSLPTTAGPQNSTGYLVDLQDSIKFPVLGKLLAGGLTKQQLENEITQRLLDQKLLTDPIVTVRVLNFRVTVLGEVARPSTINVTNEKISILEALGLAGDLTIYAKRDNILLIREEDNKKTIKRLNLNSPELLSSPYYYLKTNDIVYVEPNKTKAASASRSTQLLPIILSALSFVAIIVSYYIHK